MLVKDIKRRLLFISAVLFLVYLVALLFDSETTPEQETLFVAPAPTQLDSDIGDFDLSQDDKEIPVAAPNVLDALATPTPSRDDGDAMDLSALAGLNDAERPVSHQEVFSSSTKDTKFFVIDFGDIKAINPNILPHPTLDDTWIVVAQQMKDLSTFFYEVSCNAVFQDDMLRCLHPPTPLPVAATAGERCEGDLSYMNAMTGPHDARVFFGPAHPYIAYGSNSQFTCLGQFIQDFRMLVEWQSDMPTPTDFRIGTELQRPLPWSTMEKNWFAFWDAAGDMYIHYDIAPKRVFSAIALDGSAGPDLAPFAEVLDEKCLSKYLPQLASDHESIHQATNSLQITMCRKADASCVPDAANTFIFTIVQHKKYYDFHGVYEPYVVIFQQRAPFEIYAISQRPIWIHGRELHFDLKTSDMFYVTSMSWKGRNQKYHGYLDDELFLAFGIEDKKAGGIDVSAWDLLQNLGICAGF
ncbi:hypothetical protein B0J13DRAFT_152404 [Dactylonectria estremocensis]|uniref:Uncharacterized protein n=1 Tax=Dactylonectria estremocensis TaxID=1079267 RepID=A0A9P9DQM7_9HYPO|nr:hypothetical protein B0J13DRAFT_152404 [Dactylonectria estremocensis]